MISNMKIIHITSIANKVPTEDQLTYDHETQRERENHNHQLELRKRQYVITSLETQDNNHDPPKLVPGHPDKIIKDYLKLSGPPPHPTYHH